MGQIGSQHARHRSLYSADMRLGAIVLGCALLSGAGCTWNSSKPSSQPKPTAPKAATPKAQPKAKTQPPLNPFLQIASRFQHSCALRKAGDVLCWGKNTYGQLGNGGRTDSPRLSKVRGLTGVKQVEVGRDFSCALRTNGSVMCWGNNEDGQLGDGRGGSPGAMSLDVAGVRG